MPRKALIALYAIEALYLLVPWQYFINGRLLLNYNDGIVMWLGVPGFYALARIAMRAGPTLWVRLGGMAWTLMWIVAAVVLIDNDQGARLLLLLTGWILVCNFLMLVGPLGWEMRRMPQLHKAEQDEPSALALGAASWLVPFIVFLLVNAADMLPVWRFKSTFIGMTLAPMVLLSPVLAITGVLKGVVELRRNRKRWTAGGLGLSGTFLVVCVALFAVALSL